MRLRELRQVIGIFGELIDLELPLMYALMFISAGMIHREKERRSVDLGIDMQDLCRMTGVSVSTLGRQISALGQGRKGKKGLGLMRIGLDPMDRRRRPVYLTAKGVRALERLEAI